MFRSLALPLPARFAPSMMAALLCILTLPARAADHRDGPLLSNGAPFIGNLDLNDLFVFVSPSNPNNTVLILTTGGNGVGFITPPIFYPGAGYEIRINNRSSDPAAQDNLVFQFVFSNPNRVLRQSFQMYSVDPITGDRRQQLSEGTTSVHTDNPYRVPSFSIRGGGRVTAGLFDDPFFFDSLAFPIFTAVVDRRINGVSMPGSLAERTAAFTGIPFPTSVDQPSIRTARFPVNGFANTNILAIVIEIPRLRLQSSPGNSQIKLWIRSLTPEGAQFDRTAIPAVNTTIVPSPTAMQFAPGTFSPTFGPQEYFNLTGTPRNDAMFRPTVARRIQDAYGASPETAMALANTLLPDVMPFDTTSKKGFNKGLTLTLNGRKLDDDVVDAELNALTSGALKSDRVVNDSFFRKSFPYLGTPLPVTRVLANGGVGQ